MNCKDKEGCRKKHLQWLKNQKKYIPIGQKELDNFLSHLETNPECLVYDRHFEKNRSFKRSITRKDVTEILKNGWVIERKIKHGMVSLLIMGYTKNGKNYRPIHVVFDVVKKDLWVVTTTYDSRSMWWKWDDTFQQRICFCK